MHGQEPSPTLLSRDCAFVSTEQETSLKSSNPSFPSSSANTTNTATTNTITRQSMDVGGNNASSPTNNHQQHQYHDARNQYPNQQPSHHYQQQQHYRREGGGGSLPPTYSLLPERDHNQHTIPSLSTLYGNSNTTNSLPGVSRMDDSDHHHHSSYSSTRQQQQQYFPPIGSESSMTQDNTHYRDKSYHDRTPSHHHHHHSTYSNTTTPPPPPSSSPYPYPSSERSNLSTPIRTAHVLSSIPSPSSLMQQHSPKTMSSSSTTNASVPPHSPVGIISRSSAYPPSIIGNNINNGHDGYHHHMSSAAGSGYGSQPSSSVPFFPSARSSAPPLQHHRSSVDVETMRPAMDTMYVAEQNAYHQHERNAKNFPLKGKQIEHKSCIICGKADTGNKYISYTINESNIDQYKGCFRHVPEIRIGDGVCKNCYAKKYKYVTGLSINKVKRKNNMAKNPTATAESSMVPQPTRPLSPGSMHHAPSRVATNHSISNHSTTVHHGHQQQHHVASSSSHVHSHHHHQGHYMHADRMHEDYRSNKYNMYNDPMMHSHQHHQPPPSHVDVSPMHAHYSASYNSSHPRSSSPVSPPSASSSSRKAYYHPYASNNEHAHSYVNHGPNSTTSSGSSNNNRGNMMHDPFRSAPPGMHSTNYQHATTSPHSPRNNTSVPSIMEMMDTAPPSYGMNVNSERNLKQHEPRIESASPLSSHRYHPYSNVYRNNNNNGKEDVAHSPRIYNQDYLPKLEPSSSPNPSPIRVASIVATGPALPGNTTSTTLNPTVTSSISSKSYSPQPISPLNSFNPQHHALVSTPTRKQEELEIPTIKVNADEDVKNNENATHAPSAFTTSNEEDKNDLKDAMVEPLVNVFLTFDTITTQSPTTRVSIPKKIGLNQLKEIIQKRVQKNMEEENNMLQLGNETNVGNVMLKKDENNYIEIDDQFCAIYRFEHHDSLRISLIK